VDANVLQGKFDDDVRQRFRVAGDSEDFFVGHRVRVVAKQIGSDLVSPKHRTRQVGRRLTTGFGASNRVGSCQTTADPAC
jgi:hypothetical protein